MTICHIALGGNIGDVIATMDRGLDLLDEFNGVTVIAASPVYRTEPVGPCSGDAFLNAAATLECELEPLSLLRLLKSVEESVGRESGTRWSPRPLDLDLLLIGETIVREPPLNVPHPHMWYRRFVLDPLVDIAADAMHPLFSESIREIQARLFQRPLPISLHSDDSDRASQLGRLLTARHPEVTVIVEQSPTFDNTAVAITLDLNISRADFESSTARCVRVADLPDSIENAALSVLTAALDQPLLHKRPLRRMP